MAKLQAMRWHFAICPSSGSQGAAVHKRKQECYSQRHDSTIFRIFYGIQRHRMTDISRWMKRALSQFARVCTGRFPQWFRTKAPQYNGDLIHRTKQIQQQRRKNNIGSQISSMCSAFFCQPFQSFYSWEAFVVCAVSIVLFVLSSSSNKFSTLFPVRSLSLFLFHLHTQFRQRFRHSLDSLGNYLPFPKHNDD